jgi:hypothetical protein
MIKLSLNLHRAFFCAILDGSKKIEYRDKTDYWKKRLKGKKYTHVKFRNGYLKVAPEMTVELKKVIEKPDCFEFHLGTIIEKKNTDILD